jgi:hypothetical protein
VLGGPPVSKFGWFLGLLTAVCLSSLAVPHHEDLEPRLSKFMRKIEVILGSTLNIPRHRIREILMPSPKDMAYTLGKAPATAFS